MCNIDRHRLNIDVYGSSWRLLSNFNIGCKVSLRIGYPDWCGQVDERTDVLECDYHSFSDAQITKFSYSWCSAIIFNHVYMTGNRVKSNFFNLNIKDSWITEKKFQAEVYYFPPTGKTSGKRSGDDSFLWRSRKKLQPPGGGRGTWVFFGWVCAARDSKLAPRSKKKFPLKLIPRSRNGPMFYTPF